MAKKKQQEPTLRRQRRTIDQQIADLQAKIAAIKERDARKKAKSDPALRHASVAARAVDKALAATDDARIRKLLDQARSALGSCLGVEVSPESNSARRVANDALPEALMAYVSSNPGQRGEQIAAALGTDAGTIRPVMKRLIGDGKVRTKGQRRGMTYAAV